MAMKTLAMIVPAVCGSSGLLFYAVQQLRGSSHRQSAVPQSVRTAYMYHIAAEDAGLLHAVRPFADSSRCTFMKASRDEILYGAKQHRVDLAVFHEGYTPLSVPKDMDHIRLNLPVIHGLFRLSSACVPVDIYYRGRMADVVGRIAAADIQTKASISAERGL